MIAKITNLTSFLLTGIDYDSLIYFISSHYERIITFIRTQIKKRKDNRC